MHANAFGAGISDKVSKAFFSKIQASLQDFDFSINHKVDFIYGLKDCLPQDILDIANLKCLWGQGVEEPKLAFEKITIPTDRIILMSPDQNPTLKINLPTGVACIKFKFSKEEYEQLTQYPQGAIKISLVGKCEKNEWNGQVTPQILIDDYEIEEFIPYYF